MTIREAIETCDFLKPNRFSYFQKVSWLNELDGMIKAEIIDTHTKPDTVIFAGYDDNTDSDTVLLVEAPYSGIYIHFLLAEIDFYNDELTSYGNSISIFDKAYLQFAAYYNRKYTPLQKNGITL